MPRRKKIVFVGMSGGVDSSVSAYLLKRAGYDVVGVFMAGYNIDGCDEKDSEDARRAAEKIGIPFYVWDFKQEYKRFVVDYMIGGYKQGLTPNPDVMCNKEIKFGLFLERAKRLGADYIATGHYAVVDPQRRAVFAAKDKNKDQTYFLWAVKKNDLKFCLFPVGKMLKSEVRRVAKSAGLLTAEKKDSQGICFLGKVSIDDFLKIFIPAKEGLILDEEGREIGRHQGAWYYTVGQRHGLGVPGKEPLYVAEKNVKKNVIVAVPGQSRLLLKNEFEIGDVNLLVPEKEIAGSDILCRVRYRQPLFPGRLSKKGNRWIFQPQKSQKFVAEGQSAVFYDKKGRMLGGGIIAEI
ncbi:MAG: tRNA 2-thiouridine(34) synthase MnmA [Patescibacteria group bacterium]|nr:tRNA 2-thiouridine(34) synthase MnmA [Patescibacteria group bacterium]MCL5261729.1 tRNA 2-thiouridine(34) synthase MnmA [Patescibacteria group bacterium]